MKTLLLCMALMALQMGALGQPTANNTKHTNSVVTSKSTTNTASVADTKAESKNGVKYNADLFKNQASYESPEFAHFFKVNVPPSKEESFVFLVGSSKVPGYKIQVCNVKFNNKEVNATKRFNNGKSAPVLQLFVDTKTSYVGSTLEDDKGKKTTITDASLVEDGNTLKFTVVGKDFSRSLTLENGEILSQNSTTLVLYTDKIGIWKVIKK